MTRLLLDLAQVECRVAALALAGGGVREATRCLSRAAHYLELRGADESPGEGPTPPAAGDRSAPR